jgi:hypothetical protein
VRGPEIATGCAPACATSTRSTRANAPASRQREQLAARGRRRRDRRALDQVDVDDPPPTSAPRSCSSTTSRPATARDSGRHGARRVRGRHGARRVRGPRPRLLAADEAATRQQPRRSPSPLPALARDLGCWAPAGVPGATVREFTVGGPCARKAWPERKACSRPKTSEGDPG